MPVEIAIHNEEAIKALAKLEQKLKTVKDGGRAFGMALSAVVFADVIDHFEKEEGPEGAWQPWSTFYREHMEKIGKGGNRLLMDTGRLRQSFTPTNYRKTAEGIMWFNPARTKSGFPYAFAHNEGGEQLPARTFMWLSDAASERIASVTLNFVLGRE